MVIHGTGYGHGNDAAGTAEASCPEGSPGFDRTRNLLAAVLVLRASHKQHRLGRFITPSPMMK